MKVYVEYPVMVTPGVFRYETEEVNLTVEQIPYLAEDIDRQIVINGMGCFICVKSKSVADRIAMTPKSQINSTMSVVHINNLISLVTDTVDQIHRGDLTATNKAIYHLQNNPEIYGDIPEEVYDHVTAVILAIDSELCLDDHDDYYSDFDLQ